MIIDKEITTLCNRVIELKQYRESALRPAAKFVNQPMELQLAKLDEEVKEVHAEMFGSGSYVVTSLAQELADVQMVCETILAHMGLNEQQRMDVRKQVIEKNRVRGYYEGDK
jgi:predicted house-cleaning noncanonical NTP pyrophosphatase (MazG superfamily)